MEETLCENLNKIRTLRHRRIRDHIGTCQQNVGSDYTEEETEFIKAMAKWMGETGRRFPSFTDCLHVLIDDLGYRKIFNADT